jgi:hypothetical protein
MRSLLGLLVFFLGLQIAEASVSGGIPPCLDDDYTPLAVNNAHVLMLRESTQDQHKDRAFVQGVVTNVYADRTGHNHFAVNLDAHPAGDIELIYNQKFGVIPRVVPGMSIMACGDYITAGPRSRLPSPMGAIIHWLHYNPGDRDGGKHPHGFIAINGKVYGYN